MDVVVSAETSVTMYHYIWCLFLEGCNSLYRITFPPPKIFRYYILFPEFKCLCL
jgi:hypothetical protein